jgi:hypothetical protein
MDVEPLKDAFWAIVVDCLHHFHRMDSFTAQEAAAALRNRVEAPSVHDRPPPGYNAEIFYHNEPFYVACDIAAHDLDVESRRAEYESIQRERYAVGERAALAGALAQR